MDQRTASLELRIRYTSLDQLEDLRHRLLRKPGR